MADIQEKKDLPQKPKAKVEANSGNHKKKRPGQRQRKRNKINKSTQPELIQKHDVDTEERQTLNSNELSVSKFNDLDTDTKVKIETNSSTILTSTAVWNHISETDQLNPIKHHDASLATKSLPNISNPLQQPVVKVIAMSANSAVVNPIIGKSREEIMAEREAKKLAKQTKKVKAGPQTTPLNVPVSNTPVTLPPHQTVVRPQKQEVQLLPTTIDTTNANEPATGIDKTREKIKAEREAKKKGKQALKEYKAAGVPELAAQLEDTKITTKLSSSTAQEEKKKPTLSKAERRALQEAQRAAKTHKQIGAPGKSATSHKANDSSKSTTSHKPIKTSSTIAASPSPTKSASPMAKSLRTKDCKVRLFNHLENARQEVSLFLNNPHIHPIIARLGEQYAKRTIVGSNARCIAFLNALQMVIRDFETPPKKEFARSLETAITNSVDHLQKCRPVAVSVSNAYKHIKHVLTQLPTDQPETDLKENLCHFIETYIENQIGKAAEAISYSVQEKISNGDVILTFGCSSLITYIFEEAQRRSVDFRVIVVDSRPFCEGQELLRRLTAKQIPCSYVLINAISFVMPEATKVLLGAHALLANGYVMARTGTAQVALVARSFNVPVLVCCETHKFSERSQTDAIVYNELGNPDDLIRSDKCSLTNWQSKGKMSPLNLMYDITPPELVTAVVTEVSILPCTSVPVILRIKPTEIGY